MKKTPSKTNVKAVDTTPIKVDDYLIFDSEHEYLYCAHECSSFAEALEIYKGDCSEAEEEGMIIYKVSDKKEVKFDVKFI